MKKTAKKFISLILAAVMVMSTLSALLISASADDENYPTIFLDGIASSNTVNKDTGDVVFPPSADDIMSGLKKGNLSKIIGAVAKGDYSSAAGPIADAVIKIFESSSMDENGNPKYNTTTSYSFPDESTILRKAANTSHGSISDYVYFSHDWRLDMKTLAENFHDFVEYVIKTTGAKKVNVISFSMGTCILTTYMYQYDYEYLNNVVLLSGGYNGVAVAGESFNDKLKFDAEDIDMYVESMTSMGYTMQLVSVLVDILYEAGIVDGAVDIVNKMLPEIADTVYKKGLKYTFARIPGLWSLIPYDMYDSAKESLISVGDNVSQEFVDKIDYYHYNVQANNESILDKAKQKGINVSIVAKYGSMSPPVVESQTLIGDQVIDTGREAFGATTSTVSSTLGDNYVQAVDDGHNHISADRQIDASTCRYPENTWFIKGKVHADHYSAEFDFLDWLLSFNGEEPTVHTDERYPQFLIYIPETESIEPLTEENNYSTVTEKTKDKGFFEKIKSIFSLIRKFFKLLGQLIKTKC